MRNSHKFSSLTQILKNGILYKILYFFIIWKDYNALQITFPYIHMHKFYCLHYFQKVLLLNMFSLIRLMFLELSEKMTHRSLNLYFTIKFYSLKKIDEVK